MNPNNTVFVPGAAQGGVALSTAAEYRKVAAHMEERERQERKAVKRARKAAKERLARRTAAREALADVAAGSTHGNPMARIEAARALLEMG